MTIRHKNILKLYWKNGGWLSLAILGVIIAICLILAINIVPILRHERIENVKTKILFSTNSLNDAISSMDELVRFWIINNSENILNQDSVSDAYIRLMEDYAAISGNYLDDFSVISGIYLEYRDSESEQDDSFSQFFRFSPNSSKVVCIDEPKFDAKPEWDELATYFSRNKETQLCLGSPQYISYLHRKCMPLNVMTSMDNITFLVTVYADINFIRKFSNFQNPYPNGQYFIISHDGFFVNASNDSLIHKPAEPWIREHFGEQVVLAQPSDSENNIVSCSNNELTFIKTYMYHKQRILLYSVPTYELTADLSELQNAMLIYCLSGMFVISLLCFYIIKKNTRSALRHEQSRKDMETAAEIQNGMLPKPLKCASVDINSVLFPSKLIGGDLYYYSENDGLLYFCIGDVSGKGMSAAMFMSKTISLFQYMSQHSQDVRVLAEQLNSELTKNNETNMFVTIFIGIFNYKTGVLSYCNAGHDEPIFWNGSDGSKPEYLNTSFNLPLGVDPDIPYQDGSMKLGAGSVIMLYTDGITEAMNKNKEQYGEERLFNLFTTNKTGAAESINTALLDSIHTFVGKHEQSDDITILTLKIKAVDETISLRDDPESLSVLKPFFDKISDTLIWNDETSAKVRAAVDEASTNVVIHGFVGKTDTIVPEITLHAFTTDNNICFVLRDNGIPFNPLEYSAPEMDDLLDIDIPDMKIGGLGIPTMKLTFDSIHYERTDDYNVLTMKKKLL